MQYLDFAKARFDAAIQEIQRLKHYEFPYPHIKEALNALEELFQQRRSKLDTISPKSTPDVAKNACQHSLAYLFRFTPYLGFVVRATNIRNAFELYPPLMRLARRALGPKTKLLLSSEWDYSPFIYLPQKELSNFVVIGVPSYESSNALLIPLAGHELGHSIWNQQSLASRFKPKLEQAVLEAIQTLHWNDFEAYCPQATKTTLSIDIFVREAWLPILAMATRQLEEIYCDVMGIRLFSESYLNAFAYLLAPGLPSEQSLNYPEILKRVRYLEEAAKKLGVVSPEGYTDLFQSQPLPANPVFKLFSVISGSATEGMVGDLVNEIIQFAGNQHLPERREEEVTRIKDDFSRIMPCEGNSELCNIVNAGWQIYLDSKIWSGVFQLQRVDRGRVLNDLLLKSCEVAEYEERLRSP